MLNRAAEAQTDADQSMLSEPLLREPRWVAPPGTIPIPVVAWSPPATSAGVHAWTGPTIQFQAFDPTRVAPAAPVAVTTVPRAKFSKAKLLHLDVLLPAIAAVLVLIVLLAWGA